jgi:hypothetical protein
VSQATTLDDQFAAVARAVPAFGGMFVAEDEDAVYLYLTDTSPAVVAAARAELEAQFGPGSLPQTRTRALPARYSFQELKVWHERLADLLALPGVVLTDIDDRSNRLTVGVERLDLQPAVEAQLARLGVPRAAVAIEQVAPVELETSLRTRHRPLVGGLQVSFVSGAFSYICTLGFNAVRQGVAGYVVNSHCTAIQGGVESTVHYQPSVASSNRIGVETVDPTYFTGGSCPSGRRCRYSDSAFARRDSGVSASQGFIARTPLNSISWNGVDTYRITAEGDPFVGLSVTKVGRTTGRTQGSVSRTCTNFNVAGSTITQLCQAQASYSSNSGDSGSPVFSIRSGNDVTLRGIHWGSGGVFSPIGTTNIQRSSELGPITTCASGFSC